MPFHRARRRDQRSGREVIQAGRLILKRGEHICHGRIPRVASLREQAQVGQLIRPHHVGTGSDLVTAQLPGTLSMQHQECQQGAGEDEEYQQPV